MLVTFMLSDFIMTGNSSNLVVVGLADSYRRCANQDHKVSGCWLSRSNCYGGKCAILPFLSQLGGNVLLRLMNSEDIRLILCLVISTVFNRRL